MPEREDLSGFLYLHVSCPLHVYNNYFFEYVIKSTYLYSVLYRTVEESARENEGLLLEF